MSSYKQHIHEFLEVVCKEIRFKGIHKHIAQELSDHIEDQITEYVHQGFDEENAGLRAVKEMGDPVSLGKQLDKAHRPQTEWSILFITSILVILGGAVQYFLSGMNTNNVDMFSRFLLYAPIGIIGFAVMYFFDYTLLGRYSKLVYFLIFIITVMGFVFLRRVRGAYIYMYYSALLFIPAFAGIVYYFRNKGYLGIIVTGLFYMGAAFMCILAPSTSSLLLLSVACLSILTAAIIKGFWRGNKKISLIMVYASALLTLGAIAFSAVVNSPYVMKRILTFLNPELDPQGAGYVTLMVRKLISASKPFGEAVLEGSMKNMSIHQLLPMWYTDLSLTYIIARLGYIPGIAIIVLMSILVVRMFASVFQQKNTYGFLLSFSCCLAITGQIIFYVLANTGLIPVLSYTLPFISYGALGFVTNMILLGLLLSVYRRTQLVKDIEQNNYNSRPWIIFLDGKIIIDLNFKNNL